MMLHNALVGCGLRDRIRIGASGKVATGSDIVKRLAQGADYTNAARAMMQAVGCLQTQRCNTNECPVGVATQDPKRARALNIPDKTERADALSARHRRRGAAADRLDGPALARPTSGPIISCAASTTSIPRATPSCTSGSSPSSCCAIRPSGWVVDWDRADPDSFAPRPT